jgi:superfamily II DNA/RNA helicase
LTFPEENMPYQSTPRPAQKSGSKPGSKSPTHRGYRPDTGTGDKKKRWNADERAARSQAPTDGRPDWNPREKPARSDRFGRDERPARTDRYSRDERPAARGDRSRDERPARTDRYSRDERPAARTDRYSRDERPAARTDRYSRDERPADRYSRDERPAPRTDRSRDERPARTDRYSRDERPARTDDRPQRSSYGDRAQRPTRDDRAPRRDSDERPRRFDDRAPRTDDRPRRSFDDRAPRRDSDERAPRRDYSDRAPRRDSDERAPRRDFADRAPRHDSTDRPRSFGDRAPRSFDDAPVRESSYYPTRDGHTDDDSVLEKLTATAVEATDVESTTFEALGLGGNIVRTLAELGAASPFPIQAATIPDVLAGRDVLGRGRTGSGKTIAFGAPLVERLLQDGAGQKRQMGRAPRAIIMAPTRELALQIDRTIQPIARSVGLFTTQIYGGVPQARQVGALNRGVDIVIGTPGRIEDLIDQGRLDLRDIQTLVLDEADHMCELGFLEPVQRILRRIEQAVAKRGVGARAQKLLFSATLDTRVAALVKEFLVNPAVYEVAGEDQASSTINHRVLLIDQRDKRDIVAELAGGDNRTLVFTRTRAFAEELAEGLEDMGIHATSLHGDLNQAKRTRNLERLTSGKVSVLVATDVAARGIHVDDITLVIQADAPEEYKTYLHRAGRTGRAGKQGTVVTLVNRNRRRKVDELLGRAEITATYNEVRPGDDLIAELAAL